MQYCATLAYVLNKCKRNMSNIFFLKRNICLRLEMLVFKQGHKVFYLSLLINDKPTF